MDIIFNGYPWDYLLVNFIIVWIGVLGHFFKRKIKGESLSDIKSHFRDHFKSTIATVIGAVFGFIFLIQLGELTLFGSVSVGYMADSMFNKAEQSFNEIK